jgi:hypothetical protein
MTDENLYRPKGQDRYEVKVFDYNEDGPGRYPILVVRVEPEGHEILDRCGYRSKVSYLFALVEGGRKGLTGDPREFTRRFCARDDDGLYRLLAGLQRYNIPFDVVPDDGEVTPEGIETVLDTYGGEW